jgi:protein CpxP
MKNNSKWITAVAVLGLSATLAVAAPQNGEEGHGHGFGGKRHGELSEMFTKKLNLTDAQKQQWKDIRHSSKQANAAFFEQAKQTRKDFHAAKEANDTAKASSLKATLDSQRAQFQQIRAADEQKLMTILTPDQRAQFDAMKAERAAHHAEHQHQQ